MAYKILVVEDEATMRRLMTLLLKRKGHELLEAESGEQAIEITRIQRPDIILLDIMMPGIDGFETLRRLRAMPDTAAIPVIFLSAKSQVEDRIEGLRLGADDYIIKPADPEELAARIDAVMARSQPRVSARQQGKTVGFMGVKGGVGTTTVVANLGVHLYRNGHSILLVDLHLAFGNLADLFKLETTRTTSDLAALPPAQITVEAVERTRLGHPSGINVLASPAQVPNGVTYSAEHLAAILEQATYTAQMVLVDLPVDADIVAAVAEQLDALVLVTGGEPATMRAAQNIVGHMDTLRLHDRMSVILLNRVPIDRRFTGAPVADQFHCPLLGTIPPQPELYLLAETEGLPLLLTNHEASDRLLYEQISNKLLNYEKELETFQKGKFLRGRHVP